jgi:lysophospholipase L1-like esterase
MLFTLGAIAAAAAAQAPDPPRCDATLCNAEAIAPFLARLRASRPDSGAPVHILQIGDSHTAGDMITAGWRTRLQALHGHGGRGVLAAGRPYAGYLTWGVTASQSGGWSANAMFGGRYRAEGAPLGISGFTQSARSAGETLGLATDSPDQDFDRIIVCAIVQPGGGTIALQMGAARESWSLDGPRSAPACRTMDSDAPVSSASITTEDDGIVSIASFGTFRRRGGVILSNLGVVGAQLVHFARTSDELVRAEFAAYRPDLIVLAFGTNEGFSPSPSADNFEATFGAQVARVRRLAGPGVPILILAAPDAGTRQPALARGGEACGDGWTTPRLLGQVRERQLRIARRMRAAFWNWAVAMGGRCSASQWHSAELMRGDHVHFTRAGGDRIGGLIDADIARAAEAAPPARPDGDGRRRP